MTRTRRARQAGPIIAIGPFPPPVTGASTITAALVAELGQSEVVRHNTAPIVGRGLVAYHGSRLLRATAALVSLVLRRKGAAYISLQGGLGQAYDLAFVVAARLRRRSVYMHHHSFRYIRQRTRLQRGIYWLAGSQTTHIFLCASMRSEYESTYGRTNGCVISNASLLPEPLPTKSARAEPEVLRVGHLGNLTAEKGVDEIVRVAQSCITQAPAAAFHIAGPVRDSHLRSKLIAEPSITWLGPIYGNEKAEFLDGLDVFFFPSRYEDEAEPLVLLEALRSGAVIYASDCGCIPEVLSHADAKVLPVEQLSHALIRLLAHPPSEVQRMEARTRNKAAFDDLRRGACQELAYLVHQIAKGAG